jgi:hypothetical protein
MDTLHTIILIVIIATPIVGGIAWFREKRKNLQMISHKTHPVKPKKKHVSNPKFIAQDFSSAIEDDIDWLHYEQDETR